MKIDASFVESRERLRNWLLASALPVWSNKGCDFVGGGFYERLADDLSPIEEPRRARLVSRQIYVFSAARSLGWKGPSEALVDHGMAFLSKWIMRDDGGIWSAVQPDGRVVRSDYDLYDYAFVLFALSSAARSGRSSAKAASSAARIRDFLIAGWRHPLGGFEDAWPRKLPLRANPHMHMLESCLSWLEVVPDDEAWGALADEIAELAMARMIQSETGALPEYFDGDWRAVPGEAGLVEPGHQFEWAWLLFRWAELRGRPHARTCATRLMDVGERYGTRNGVVLNELNEDLSIRDPAARLWPQTERIKAWCAGSGLQQSDVKRTAALLAATSGVDTLMTYFAAAPDGLWREIMEPDGSFRREPTRASSLYHIVGAVQAVCAVSVGQPAHASLDHR